MVSICGGSCVMCVLGPMGECLEVKDQDYCNMTSTSCSWAPCLRNQKDDLIWFWWSEVIDTVNWFLCWEVCFKPSCSKLRNNSCASLQLVGFFLIQVHVIKTTQSIRDHPMGITNIQAKFLVNSSNGLYFSWVWPKLEQIISSLRPTHAICECTMCLQGQCDSWQLWHGLLACSVKVTGRDYYTQYIYTEHRGSVCLPLACYETWLLL